MQTYFSRLVTSEQRYAYEINRQALEQKSAFAEVRCDKAPIQVYEAVIMDYPQFALRHPVMNCVYDGRIFAFQYIDVDEEKYAEGLGNAERKIRQTYEKRGDFSDFALYRAIYDYLAETVKYDYDAYSAYIRLQRQDGVQVARFCRRYGNALSPYGAIVEKKAVCNGIAKAYQILCERFSLPCACVQARTVFDKNPPAFISDDTQCDHLLNVVEIDGVQAFVDVTDGLAEGKFAAVRYDSFLVNYDVLKSKRLLRESDLRAFVCDGPRNIYFQRMGLVFTSVVALRRFLVGYIAKFGRGKIRFSYSGKMSDAKLKRFCDGILSAHCSSMKTISGTECDRGFCNCAIIDRK